MTLICAKFGAVLINIFKVTSHKTNWQPTLSINLAHTDDCHIAGFQCFDTIDSATGSESDL